MYRLSPTAARLKKAVLGAVLINPEAFFDVSQFLKQDDFYIVRNRWIWESFIRLHEKRAPIDFSDRPPGPGAG